MISCIVNFKENLLRMGAYYKLLLNRIDGGAVKEQLLEHCAMSAGDEPYTKICEGYQFTIIFSGELWNTEPLRSELEGLGYCFLTDTYNELALNAYIHYGERCMEMLQGNFSLVVYDAMRRQVFAAVDGYASHALYYSQMDRETVICSKIPGILRYPDFCPKVNYEGMCRLLSFSSFSGEGIFEGIEFIPPAHYLRLTCSGAFLLEYEPPEYAECAAENETDIKVISTKGAKSLCEALAREHSFCRIATCSFCDAKEVEKAYSTNHKKLTLCEHLLSESIKTSVLNSGFPVLCEDEYLLPLIFAEKGPIYMERSLMRENSSAYFKFAADNRLFYTPVLETIQKFDADSRKLLRIPEYEGVSLRVRVNNSEAAGVEVDEEELERLLKRLLLETAARQNTPIASFFDRGAILRLCEGRLAPSEIKLSIFMAYILQLDIWFSECKPRLI